MATRSERDRQKAVQEKHQMILSQLLKDEDNKYCVDCDAKGPRWASWNLGIFLCIRCAGIHRNLGVHISKVKSVNLDTWTPEQIAMMQDMGNSRARAVYEANVPDSYRRPQTDSGLEAFIRSKYEQKKYIAHEWVPPQPRAQPIFEEMPRKDRKKTRSKPDSSLKLSAPPVSSSNKPHVEINSSKPVVVNEPKQPAKSAYPDLLGLDDPAPAPSSDSGDIFGDFIGNTTIMNPPNQPQPAVSHQPLVSTIHQNGDINPASTPANGELNSTADSNQSLLGEGSLGGAAEKKSKESILALYGSGGGVQQPMYSVPGGMYMSGQQQMPVMPQGQMYSTAQMGTGQMTVGQMGTGQMVVGQMGTGQMTNGMVSGIQPGLMTQPQNNMMQQQQGVPMWNTNMAMPVNNMAPNPGGMPTGMSNAGMMNNMMMGGGQGMYTTPNMYNMPNQQMNQLQNQMTGMNLGTQTMGSYQQQPSSTVGVGGMGNMGGGGGGNWGIPQTGNTLSTNLWQ